MDNILTERGKHYGEFLTNSAIAQNLKKTLRESPNWPALSFDKREALELIATKLARILNGDPKYIDSWRDIAGYVHLVINQLEQKNDE